MDERTWTDLAVRTTGGSVVWANDEAFAERENLLNPGPPVHDPSTFGHKGKVYDGWETRRRRAPGHDEAIIRLGVPGVVHRVVVDTAWFKGNFPPQASVEGVCLDGYPAVDELRGAAWEPLVPVADLKGDTENEFAVESTRRWTHVRLSIYPDGGVARLRAFGEPLPDPRLLHALGHFDLAALEYGGRVVGCSDWFFGSPENLLMPGRARSMGEGWETARRRDEGNDWVVVRLAEAGTVFVAEVDTSYFLGNAPGEERLRGCRHPDAAGCLEDVEWFELLPRTRLAPDTQHRFVLEDSRPATHVRMDVYPDGGVARLRLHGALTEDGRALLQSRWTAAIG
ncbi:MAG: allantoicase [Actinomycetota bacterium]|nr:allantoicase [Actinomycetota bacterium]